MIKTSRTTNQLLHRNFAIHQYPFFQNYHTPNPFVFFCGQASDIHDLLFKGGNPHNQWLDLLEL